MGTSQEPTTHRRNFTAGPCCRADLVARHGPASTPIAPEGGAVLAHLFKGPGCTRHAATVGVGSQGLMPTRSPEVLTLD